MGNAFDSVDANDLKQLDSKGAVKLLHKLIYAEAKRLNIPADVVSVPYEVDTPDGGIDAVFKTGSPITGSELIFEGKTYYQVKSGEKVQFTEAGLKNVLCEDKKKKGAAERALKPKVKEIAEENGTLILFFTGKSAPKIEEALETARKIIEYYLPETKLIIRIVQADNIIAILDNYLSLRHDLLHIQGFPGWLFDEWEKKPIMGNYFEDDERRTQKIEDLRHLIRSTLPEDKTIRVTGYPGIGKTRSVLEAVRQEDLSPLVIYFDKPSTLIDANLLVEMGTRRQNEAIIIVDECDHHSHIQLVSALAGAQSKIKLVTIYNEASGTVKDVKNVDLGESEVLASESIVAIIESYGLPNDVAKRWEPFCDGSPRVAHMIAENLSRNNGDLLSNPSYDLAMERILANTEDLKSETYQKRKNILSWLSLFQKFGWSKEFANERKFIVNKIREKTKYSEEDIQTVIQELKDRKVLQGDKTLYISPRLLHIRAWVWWWEKYGDNFDLSEMRNSSFEGQDTEMSDDLYDWFTQMFEYAREVEGASEVVKKLLASDGPLSSEPELMEALSGNFFLSLTKADPENSLSLLENWFDKKTDAELATCRDQRMNLVRALENIAIWGPLFQRAAQLMLRLASTEQDHTYSNNSEGTFAELFSNGWGKVAPTEASPPERFPVLEKAVRSKNIREQLMGLNGINKALQTSGFVRISGPEIQGLREEPKLWLPETYREIFDAIRSAWLLLLDVLPDLSEEHKDQALKIIDSHIRSLITVREDALEYLREYTALVKDGIIPHGDAIDSVNTIRRFDSKDLPDEVNDSIAALSEYLEGDDITSHLKRYIAYNSTEDWWGDDEDIKKSTSKVAELAREVVASPDLLESNSWLFTKEAQNAYRLGRGLAEINAEEALLKRIIDLQKVADKEFGDNSSILLLSGYIAALQASKPDSWQKALDMIAANDELVHWYVELVWRSSLDDHNANIVLELIKKDKVKFTDLNLFRLGGMVKNISEKTLNSWIEYLLERNDLASVAIAVDLFSSFYVFQETRAIPQDLALRVITAEPLRKEKNRQVARDIDYDWSIIVDKYIEQYPDKTDELIDVILDSFGEDDTIFDDFGDYAKKALNQLVKVNPERVWRKVVTFFGNDIKEFRLQHSWLGGGASFGDHSDGAIGLFPQQLILDWIEEDPKVRARKIAVVIPHDFDHEPTEEAWYTIILNKYGDMKEVQNALMANFGTEGWSGPESLHYAQKLERVKRFAELNKTSLNIQNWTGKVIKGLDDWVQQARMEEERRGY